MAVFNQVSSTQLKWKWFETGGGCTATLKISVGRVINSASMRGRVQFLRVIISCHSTSRSRMMNGKCYQKTCWFCPSIKIKLLGSTNLSLFKSAHFLMACGPAVWWEFQLNKAREIFQDFSGLGPNGLGNTLLIPYAKISLQMTNEFVYLTRGIFTS